MPTVAMRLDRPGEAVAAALAPHGIMAGGGDFYAVRLLQALGVDPAHVVLRLSFVHYTSPAEVATWAWSAPAGTSRFAATPALKKCPWFGSRSASSRRTTITPWCGP